MVLINSLRNFNLVTFQTDFKEQNLILALVLGVKDLS